MPGTRVTAGNNTKLPASNRACILVISCNSLKSIKTLLWKYPVTEIYFTNSNSTLPTCPLKLRRLDSTMNPNQCNNKSHIRSKTKKKKKRLYGWNTTPYNKKYVFSSYSINEIILSNSNLFTKVRLLSISYFPFLSSLTKFYTVMNIIATRITFTSSYVHY